MKLEDLQQNMPEPEQIAFFHMAVGQFLYHRNYGIFKHIDTVHPVDVDAPLDFLRLIHMQALADFATAQLLQSPLWMEIFKVIPSKEFRPSAFDDVYHAAWIIMQHLGILSVRYERETEESNDMFCYVEGTPHGDYLLTRLQHDVVLPVDQMASVCAHVDALVMAKMEAEQQSVIVVPPGITLN